MTLARSFGKQQKIALTNNRCSMVQIVQTREKGDSGLALFYSAKAKSNTKRVFFRPNSPVMKGGGGIENMQFCAVLRWHMGDGCGIWGLLGACRPLYASLSSFPLPVPFIKRSRLYFLAAMTQSAQPNNPITTHPKSKVLTFPTTY